MEFKKNPKLELSRYSTLFFNIGLSLTISLVLIVFEWKIPVSMSRVTLSSQNDNFEEIIDIQITDQKIPPTPKIQQPKIIEIPDEEEIIESVEIDIDIEDEEIIEELIVENEPEDEVVDEIFSVVEEMPSFPGGNSKFYEFVSKNLKYPRKAIKANIEGKVVVRFVVGEGGDISDVEVLKGIGFDCDEEAIRVVSTSPDWIPGKQRGRNVKVRVMVPLTFDI